MKPALAIDPSINNLGWCAYLSTDIFEMGTFTPIGQTLSEKLSFIKTQLKAELPIGFTEDVFDLVVEFPQFESSQRGSVAAVKGYTFGLAAIAGFLQGAFRVAHRQTFFYTPNEWKGQIPVEGIEYRFKQKFGFKPKTEHEAHAAMLLDFHFNKLAK